MNTAFAKPIQKHQAEELAKSFFAKKVGLRADLPLVLASAPARKRGLRLSTSSDAEDVLYYVYNRGNHDGFVMIAGDDELPLTLGYSPIGAFSDKNMPDNLQSFIEAYQESIRCILADGSNHYEARTQSLSEEVSPLLKDIRWNQDYPWNAKTPIADKNHTPVGCVATATCQIMRYYKWPDIGEGSNSYYDQYLFKQRSENFNVAYDWDNMPEKFLNPNNASQVQTEAVSTLCYHVGIAENMNYSSKASGTFLPFVVKALRENFKYDKSVEVLSRIIYTQAQWESRLRQELSEGRPVLYSGYGGGGGHAFVCDGYDRDGLFHINWGWGGMSNGYFELNLLNPDALGIGGGSGGGFNEAQQMIVNFKPDKDRTSVNQPYLVECWGMLVYDLQDGGYSLAVKTSFEEYPRISTNVRVVIENEADPSDRTLLQGVDKTYEAIAPTVPNRFSTVRFGLQDHKNQLTFQAHDAKYRVYAECKGADGNYYRLRKVHGCVDEIYFNTDEEGHIKGFEDIPTYKAILVVEKGSGTATLNSYEKSTIRFKVRNSGNKEVTTITKIRLYDANTGTLVHAEDRLVPYPESNIDEITINIDRLPFDEGKHVRITAECPNYYEEQTVVDNIEVSRAEKVRTGYIISLNPETLDKEGKYYINDASFDLKGFVLKDVGTTFVKKVAYYAPYLEVFQQGKSIGGYILGLYPIPSDWNGQPIELQMQMDASNNKLKAQIQQVKEYEGKYGYIIKLSIILANSNRTPLASLRSDSPIVTFRQADTTDACVIEGVALSVYPNPTTDKLYVRDAQNDVVVTLFDMSGKIVANSKTDVSGSCTLDMTRLYSGEYVLRVGHVTFNVLKK